MSTHDLATVLSEDHLRLSSICTELELGPGSPENRRELADHLIAQLVRHEVAEEPHVSPSPALAGADDLMRRLEGLGPQDTRFEWLLSQLIRAVRRHLRETGLVRLKARYSTARLRDLGDEVLDRRKAAVSVPHPAIADRAQVATLLRTGPGFVDRARAALTSVH
ncbi:hemerythrin domain-containing protein [Amycolatopsis sp. FDAARGOS 1241]|uniref:hemerythrin domain-containing protein n=1 Tax=Amycolatopsis sp. FDAARGOS 1241 TaxID=2778070 RepID=UPI0019517D6A|nr:hemerythrin domain-containing protein [Amycolatopsis sp. FDAARGOS 1241]QRP49572.1 hemerythrin domain-containing protein [Amycolatopsis sp. FDAARGOS 1241]